VGRRDAEPKNWVWVSPVGLSAALIYVGLTIASVGLYPGSTSPLDTYLSELGNSDLSPDGWWLYDLGMIVAGVLALAFFWGLAEYYSGRASARLVRAAKGLGAFNAVAIVLTGAVAEHVNMAAHIAWSVLLFGSLVPLLFVYGLILRELPGFSRVVSWYGFAACAADVVLLVTLGIVGGPDPGVGSLLEWVVVFQYILWVVLISLDVTRGPIIRARKPAG